MEHVDEWGPLGPITQSPDDLMEIPATKLAVELMRRIHRLQQFEALFCVGAPDEDIIRSAIKREHVLIRVAETAARVRVRELAFLVVRFMTDRST